MRLVHEVGEAVELRHGRDFLFRYVYQSKVDPEESPKPYFHPLRTLAGEEVTLFRPHDHPWHTGLAMTSAYLSGENFWGGPTFVRDEGYAWLENQGRIRHRAWKALESDAASIKELLTWISHEEETWIEEERGISVGEIGPGGRILEPGSLLPAGKCQGPALDLRFADYRGQAGGRLRGVVLAGATLLCRRRDPGR